MITDMILKPHKNFILGLLSLIFFGCGKIDDNDMGYFENLDSRLSGVIDENAKIEIVAKGFDWCEGPLWLEESKMLIFSDVPKNIIHSWSEEAGLKDYLAPSGYTGSVSRAGEKGSNGLALSRDNQLLICQHGDRRVVAMDASLTDPLPNYVTFAHNFDGKKFNSPNDLAVRINGDIYFTDPPFWVA